MHVYGNALACSQRACQQLLTMLLTHRLKVMLLLSVALQSLPTAATAQDPSCNKNCGFGTQYSSGTRPDWCGGSNECYWVRCSDHLSGCGYTDNHNDSCSMPIWCEGGGC